MNIFRYSNKFLLFGSFLVFVYTIFLLISNISSGFDITDESFYILSAQNPGEIFPVIRQDGYYIGLLYSLSGHNLSYHRLFGILLLTLVSIWFAIEFYTYVEKKFSTSFTLYDKLLFVIPIMSGVLTYYKIWLITPSYNWLALVGILMVLIFLLRIVTNKELNYNRYVSIDYIILSFSLNLTFMAKPSSALLVTIVSFLFIIFEFKAFNIKKGFLSVTILTILIVSGHIIILHGSFDFYYHKLVESLDRMQLMDNSYTLEDRVITTYTLIKEFFFEGFYFHKINPVFIYCFMLITFILYMLHFKKNVLKLYTAFIYICLIIYLYALFVYGMNENFNLLWTIAIELLSLNILFIFLSILFTEQKKRNLIIGIKAIILIFILILGSFAYSFGTNNNILHTMSGSMIFIVAAILVMNYLLDKMLDTKIFTPTIGLLLSLSVLFTIQEAYKHPYRLTTPIDEQNEKVTLLGGLEVDKTTKQYIENLQRIAINNKAIGEKISLIDMTGGSPGANVILNANFFGEPWLAGAYKGSNDFTERVLKSYQGTDKLKKAWILVAPKGGRKLDLNSLNKVGLDFPNNYIKIGIVKQLTAMNYRSYGNLLRY